MFLLIDYTAFSAMSNFVKFLRLVFLNFGIIVFFFVSAPVSAQNKPDDNDPNNPKPNDQTPGSELVTNQTKVQTPDDIELPPDPSSPDVEPAKPAPTPPAAARARNNDTQPPDPYQPHGVRLRSFLFYPTLETGISYSDNVLQSPTLKKSDIGYRIAPSFILQSDWSRHSLSLTGRGDYIFYKKDISQDRDEIDLGLKGRIDAYHNTIIDLSAGFRKVTLAGSSIDQPSNGSERSQEYTYSGEGKLTREFGRMKFALSSGVEFHMFSDVDLIGGGVQRNDDRDYREFTFKLRPSVAFSSALDGFVELAYRPRFHNQSVDNSGFLRDSDGFEMLLGTKINYDALWQGEVAIGYGWRSFDDKRFNTATAFLVRANLIWKPTRRTNVNFSASTNIAETTVAGASSATELTFGTRFDQIILRNWTGFTEFEFTHRDFSDSSQIDKILGITAGLEYAISRHFALIAFYRFTHFDSGQVNRDYKENSLMLSLRLRR